MADSWADFLYEVYLDDEPLEEETYDDIRMGYRSSTPVAGFWLGEYRNTPGWYAGFLYGSGFHLSITYPVAASFAARFGYALGPGMVADAVGYTLIRAGPYAGAAIRWGTIILSRVVPIAVIATFLYYTMKPLAEKHIEVKTEEYSERELASEYVTSGSAGYDALLYSTN